MFTNSGGLSKPYLSLTTSVSLFSARLEDWSLAFSSSSSSSPIFFSRLDTFFSIVFSSKNRSIYLRLSVCQYVSMYVFLSFPLYIIPGKKSAYWQLVAVVKGTKTMQSGQKQRKLPKKPQSQRKNSLKWSVLIFPL